MFGGVIGGKDLIFMIDLFYLSFLRSDIFVRVKLNDIWLGEFFYKSSLIFSVLKIEFFVFLVDMF